MNRRSFLQALPAFAAAVALLKLPEPEEEFTNDFWITQELLEDDVYGLDFSDERWLVDYSNTTNTILVPRSHLKSTFLS